MQEPIWFSFHHLGLVGQKDPETLNLFFIIVTVKA